MMAIEIPLEFTGESSGRAQCSETTSCDVEFNEMMIPLEFTDGSSENSNINTSSSVPPFSPVVVRPCSTEGSTDRVINDELWSFNASMEAMPPPKRRKKKISEDPQSLAERQRKMMTKKLRKLQKLIPGGNYKITGGNKMDTTSMLEEAVEYLKFLKTQVSMLASSNAQYLQMAITHQPTAATNAQYYRNA